MVAQALVLALITACDERQVQDLPPQKMVNLANFFRWAVTHQQAAQNRKLCRYPVH